MSCGKRIILLSEVIMMERAVFLESRLATKAHREYRASPTNSQPNPRSNKFADCVNTSENNHDCSKSTKTQ